MTQVGVSQYCEENRGPEDRTPGVAEANLLLRNTKREQLRAAGPPTATPQQASGWERKF